VLGRNPKGKKGERKKNEVPRKAGKNILLFAFSQRAGEEEKSSRARGTSNCKGKGRPKERQGGLLDLAKAKEGGDGPRQLGKKKGDKRGSTEKRGR